MKQKILKQKLNQIFQNLKLSKKHSQIVSDYLIKAELVDASSHGLARLKCIAIELKEN